MASDRNIFTCICLDNTADSTEENRDIQQKLRQIIENLLNVILLFMNKS